MAADTIATFSFLFASDPTGSRQFSLFERIINPTESLNIIKRNQTQQNKNKRKKKENKMKQIWFLFCQRKKERKKKK